MAILLSNSTIGGSQVISVSNMVSHGVITTSNIGSQSVNYATTAGSANAISGVVVSEMFRILTSGSYLDIDSFTDNGFRSISYPGYSQILWSTNGGGSAGTIQMLFNYDTPSRGLQIRNKTDNSSWSSWGNVVMASSNQGLVTGTIITSNTIGSQSVNYANTAGSAGSASSVAWTNVTGRPTALSQFTNDVGYITSSGRAYPRRSDGGDLNFYWSGQSGQPTWLWGGNDGVNMYVYNPSNFSVNYANSAGSASSSTTAAYLPTLYAGGVQSNPQTYFGQSVGLRVAMTGVPFAWCDTLWINGYSGGDVLWMCALHTARDTTPRMWISAQTSNGSSYGTTYQVVTEYNSPYALNMNQYVRTSDSPTFVGLSTTGNTNLGDGNGDVTHINDTLHLGATDSGDAHFYFGEGSTGSIQYGSYWYWDSSYGFYWYGRNAGSNSLVMQFETNNLGYVNWYKPFNMQNNDINYLSQLHFNDNVRFYDDGNNNYLNFKWGNGGAGGIKFFNGNDERQGYLYADTGSMGILDKNGNWKVRVDASNVELYGTAYLPTTYVGYIYDRDNSGYYIDMNGSSYLYALTLSGNAYFYPRNWIQFEGYYGIWSSLNSAHFFPNDASYGAWKVTGSRNGWGGIEVGANNGNVTLMVHPNSNESGFHNNSYGWQIYWSSGTLYVGKGSYGGSNATVLDSSNYTTWVPTKTGSGASGTWGIDISGTAAVATTAISVPGYWPVNTWIGSTYLGSGEIYSPIFYDANDSYYRVDPNSYTRLNDMESNAYRNYGWYCNSQWGSSGMLYIGVDGDPAYPLQFGVARWDICLYTTAGQLWATGFVNSSDIRLKTNIANINGGLNTILSLNPITYTLLSDANQKTHSGLVAQEVEPILPHLVTSSYDPETLEDIKGIDYIQLVPYLIQAIKEQNTLIQDLTQRIANLENQ